MKIPQPLLFALTGWGAAVVATVGVGLYWPTIFPGIVELDHYYGAGPGLPLIIGLVLLVISPAALVGGLVGSRIPKEGGRTEQILMAAIIGVILALPFACYGFWFFTGW